MDNISLKKDASISLRSIIFFVAIFIGLFYLYFNFNNINIIPFESSIKFIVLIVGILGIMFPKVVDMIRNGNENETIKKYMVNKYLFLK